MMLPVGSNTAPRKPDLVPTETIFANVPVVGLYAHIFDVPVNGTIVTFDCPSRTPPPNA